MMRSLVRIIGIAGLLSIAAPATAAAQAPDLSIAVSGPSAVGVNAPFTETATVTNQGTATATGVTVSYATGRMAISPWTGPSGAYCIPVQYGHSGRGGGFTTVGQSCSETLANGLAPGQSVKVAMTASESAAETLNLTFSAAPYPYASQLDQVSHTTVVPVTVVRPAAAAAPTNVSATESADQLNVSWMPDPATAPYLSNSVITATPTGGSTAPVLTATVEGTATSGVINGVVGSTTYSVTVANNDAGGAGAASQPFVITTNKATIVPGVPTITYSYGWADLRWNDPSAGNSAIDKYEVYAYGESNKIISFVSGSTLSDYLYPNAADKLTVWLRAHNAAGWGHWTAPIYFYDGGN
jgi:hypothetical protein